MYTSSTGEIFDIPVKVTLFVSFHSTTYSNAVKVSKRRNLGEEPELSYIMMYSKFYIFHLMYLQPPYK